MKTLLIILYITLFCIRSIYAQDSLKTVNLDEVIVKTSLKDANRESILINDSLRKNTHNALQLLNKLDGITIDWSTEGINIGKDRDVPMMINGRDMGKEYAKTLNPERIRKVEILRYPKGKYGDAPIVLNVILNNNYVGWDVDVHNREMLSLKNKHSYITNTGAAFTYSIPRWNIFGNFDLDNRKSYEALSYEYMFNQTTADKTSAADDKHPNASVGTTKADLSVGVDYSIAKNHTLSLQLWSEWRHNNSHNFYMEDASTVIKEDNIQKYDAQNYTVGLFYYGNITDRMNVTSDLSYNAYRVDENQSFTEALTNSTLLSNGKKDYIRYNVEAKYIWNNTINTVAGYTFTHRKYSNEYQQTSKSSYSSNDTRNDAYATLNLKPLRSLSLSVGGRVLNVYSKSEDESQNNSSFMGTFKMRWQILPKLALSVDYFSDVAYPNLDDLSPVLYQQNRIVWRKGNPDLQARIMRYTEMRLEISKIIKLRYMLKQSKNDLTPWYYIEDSKVINTFVGSRYTHQYAGIEGDYNLPYGIRLNITANYQWYNRKLTKDTEDNTGRTWYLDTQMMYPATKHINLMAQYFLRHDKLPLLQGESYNQEETLIIGAMTRLLKNRLSVVVMAALPVNAISKDTYNKIDLPDFKSTTINNMRVNNCLLQINLRYNISNGKTVRSKNAYINEKEK
ncbi:MAG: outer membrane beta-barrel protein [Prevotellaceae bacterium]|nr:outer membrane beta-barrel protein [Prevotellaceae bacterium]